MRELIRIVWKIVAEGSFSLCNDHTDEDGDDEGMLYEANGMWDISSTYEYTGIEGYVVRWEFWECGGIVEYIEESIRICEAICESNDIKILMWATGGWYVDICQGTEARLTTSRMYAKPPKKVYAQYLLRF